jgi:hypothetical protein
MVRVHLHRDVMANFECEKLAWEVPVMQLVHGPDNCKVVEGSERWVPRSDEDIEGQVRMFSPQEEWDRLKLVYGEDKESKMPYVQMFYGIAHNGQLEAEMRRNIRVNSRVPKRAPKKAEGAEKAPVIDPIERPAETSTDAEFSAEDLVGILDAFDYDGDTAGLDHAALVAVAHEHLDALIVKAGGAAPEDASISDKMELVQMAEPV